MTRRIQGVRLLTDAKILIIEPSDQVAKNLETLLRFLDIEPVRVASVAELATISPADTDWLAILVTAATRSFCAPELIGRLRTMSKPPPIIYMGGDSLPAIT